MKLALAKVQVAEDLWNTRDPERVVLAYTEDSQWRSRHRILQRSRGNSSLSEAEVGTRTRLSAEENFVGLPQ
jgi:nuclear transport factor 2 (NTF2) superfamily protein